MKAVYLSAIAMVSLVGISVGLVGFDLNPLDAKTSKKSEYGYFKQTGSMHYSRREHIMTTLPNGEVLVVGGDNDPDSSIIGDVPGGEVYNPTTGKFRLVGSLTYNRNTPYARGSGILLPNGKVFIVGSDAKATHPIELYNYKTERFEEGSHPLYVRDGGAYVQLNNGNVLVMGGRDAHKTSSNPYGVHLQQKQTEIYEWKTNRFVAGPVMDIHKSGIYHWATKLRSCLHRIS